MNISIHPYRLISLYQM